jgi:hypothetical protein
MTKTTKFEVIHFEEDLKDEIGKHIRRQVILLYALGEDGVVYEMASGKWLALSITEANMRGMPTATVEGNSNG